MSEDDKDNINIENKEEETKSDVNQPQGESSPPDTQPTESSGEDQKETQPKVDEKNEREVIHKRDGRLHIYIRQDKYKGELKSKNFVGEFILMENKKFLHQEHLILKRLYQYWKNGLMTFIQKTKKKNRFTKKQ